MANPIDVLAEANLRENQLLEQLARLPIVDVIGVVSAMGASGSKSRGEELWTLKLIFDAWRLQGSLLQTCALTIRRKVTDLELKSFRSLITAYKIIHIQARVINSSVSGNTDALLESLVDTVDSDMELNNFAIQLQKPVTYVDPDLGTFTLDRRINWFTGNAKWKNKSITLNVRAKNLDGVPIALRTAQALWQAQDVWEARIRDYAVHELLPLKNESWLAEDEAEVIPEQFKEKMALESITVNADGSFEFWHNDGNLFWGHSIQVRGNLTEGPNKADIPG